MPRIINGIYPVDETPVVEAKWVQCPESGRKVVCEKVNQAFNSGLDAAIAAVEEIENKSEYWNSLEGLNKSDTAMKAISSAIAAISALKKWRIKWMRNIY